jgi:hypothetical protein
MSPKLTQLLEEMTPQERAEVEAFAAFVIVRRHLQQPKLLTDDISVQELTELVAASGSLDWLNACRRGYLFPWGWRGRAMAQSIVKRGRVVLIRYPLTALIGAKVRPALVLTPDHLLPRLEDVLCLCISSAMPEELLPTDFILESGHASFSKTGLKRRSVLRIHHDVLLIWGLPQNYVLRNAVQFDPPHVNKCAWNAKHQTSCPPVGHIEHGIEAAYSINPRPGGVLSLLQVAATAQRYDQTCRRWPVPGGRAQSGPRQGVSSSGTSGPRQGSP